MTLLCIFIQTVFREDIQRYYDIIMYFIQTVFREDSDTRLCIRRHCFVWRMPSRLASLKLMRFLVFSYFITKKFLSTVDFPGNILARLPTNLSSNGYVLCSLFQAYRYAAPLSKLSMDLFTSGWRRYKSQKALCWRPIFSISSIMKVY